MEKPNPQYDQLAPEYKKVTESDPVKNYIQYPEALRLLGNVQNQSVLDVGSGNGILSKMLAKRGATVVGYDASPEQVGLANKLNADAKISYIVSDAESFNAENKFDKAVSVMVLIYAKDQEDLQKFFNSTFYALKPGSEFVIITLNPGYKRLGENAYNRRIYPIGYLGKMGINFLDDQGNTKFSAQFSNFTIDNYIKAAKDAGFSDVRVEKLQPNAEGREKMSAEFWEQFEQDSPYIGLVAEKKIT